MREKSQIIPAKFIPNFCFEATVFHKFLVAYVAEKEKDAPILLTQAESWTREDIYSTFLQFLAFILVNEVERGEGGKGQEATPLQRETDARTDVHTHMYAFSPHYENLDSRLPRWPKISPSPLASGLLHPLLSSSVLEMCR